MTPEQRQKLSDAAKLRWANAKTTRKPEKEKVSVELVITLHVKGSDVRLTLREATKLYETLGELLNLHNHVPRLESTA